MYKKVFNMADIMDFCECADKMPLIGDKAPHFRANTTNGPIEFPEDFAGRWVVLFSHPSDFTPVCTSEFIAFQRSMAAFQEINTQLVGLSVGALSSHLAWLDAISQMPDGANIVFPVIDDLGANVARLYGMMHPNTSDTSAVRAVFIIDDKGTVRAILYYPPILGRNIIEIQRMIVGLQTADAFQVAIPVNWMPGDKVLEYAPSTVASMRRRANGQPWFMQYEKLSEKAIYDKICGSKKQQKRK